MTSNETESKRSSNSSAKARRGGLGRGLGSLIPTSAPTPNDASSAPSSPASDGTPLEVSVDAIAPNPYQPRGELDPHRLDELAESIRTHGVMQPLLVTRGDKPGTYVLIAGERRWRASRLANQTTVPIMIRDVLPQAMLELAIVENVVRADLSPLEEALAYKQLIEDFSLSQSEVARRVGRSRVSVTNTLRILNSPERVQRALAEDRISEGHARALLGLPTAPDQVAALEDVIARNLSVRQTEDLVRRWQTGKTRTTGTPAERPHDEVRLEDELRSALGTKVSLKRGVDGTGGTVTIHAFSDEQLQAVYDRLVGEEHW